MEGGRFLEGEPVPGRVPPMSAACRFLISCDYDGTLRQSEGTPVVAESFFELMLSWRDSGVRWGINTGRSLPYLLEDFLPDAPFLPDFICTCERYVYRDDGNGRLLPAVEHNAACREANEKLRGKFLAELRASVSERASVLNTLNWEWAASDPLSIEAADAQEMDLIIPHMRDIIAPYPNVAIQRAGRYLRFSDARFHKGTALAYVAREWGVPPPHLILLGDGHNDLEAFRYFPGAYCAAPSSAHPEVLEALRRMGGYISSTPGVMEALLRSPACP